MNITDDRERLDRLLQRVGHGDQVAFAALYASTAARVLWTIRAKLIDLTQSEEVTQEVFLEIWQTAARFEPARGKAATWILTIAVRRAIDRVRSSQSSRERDTAAAGRDHPIPVDDVWEAASVSVEHARAVRALPAISAVQRQAVTLNYLQGLTQQEIARRLGVPVGTVKTRVRDGLAALRRVLDAA